MWIIWTHEKYLCMVLLKNVVYNKFIDSHLWFIFLHNTTSCICRLWTSKSLPFWVFDSIRNTWQHVRNTDFSNIDACADVFPRCSAADWEKYNHATAFVRSASLETSKFCLYFSDSCTVSLNKGKFRSRPISAFVDNFALSESECVIGYCR
jgi:hypothetical protein